MTDDCRQFLLSGHVPFCQQLQVLLSFVTFAAMSVGREGFQICLLWLSITCSRILTNFADVFNRLWKHGKQVLFLL